jgi:hypothetical protein
MITADSAKIAPSSAGCEANRPCIGIRLYGSDFGTLQRCWYDPDSGRVEWFVRREGRRRGGEPSIPDNQRQM